MFKCSMGPGLGFKASLKASVLTASIIVLYVKTSLNKTTFLTCSSVGVTLILNDLFI